MNSSVFNLKNTSAIDNDSCDERIDSDLRTCPSLSIFYQEVAMIAEQNTQKLHTHTNQKGSSDSKMEQSTLPQRNLSLSDLSTGTTSESFSGAESSDFWPGLARPPIILQNIKEWPYCPIKRAKLNINSTSVSAYTLRKIIDQHESAAHDDTRCMYVKTKADGDGNEYMRPEKRRRRASLVDDLNRNTGIMIGDNSKIPRAA